MMLIKTSKFLTEENFQQFIDAIPEVKKIVTKSGITTNPYTKTLKQEDFAMMFRVMYGCGLKISEATNLKTSDFDLDEKEITIRTKKGIQKTTILPSDIPRLKKYLPHEDKKIFKISRMTAWAYAKAIGKAAHLNFVVEKKTKRVEGVDNNLFRESRKRVMEQLGASKELIDLKLRSFSNNDYAGNKLIDLKNWESKFEFLPTYGVVIFGDVLGTKGVWKDKNVSEVINKWNRLVTRASNFLKRSERFKGEFSVKAFSDTIVILGNGPNVDNLLMDTGLFIKTFLHVCLMYNFPIRGCFSIGKFVDSENMMIGPAIDEAASFYEKTNWIGFSATPSSYSVLERLASNDEYKEKLGNLFTRYDVPTKTGVDKQNWVLKINPTIKFPEEIEEELESRGMTIEEICHYQLEHPVDPEGSIKWRNTLKFLRSPENSHKTKQK